MGKLLNFAYFDLAIRVFHESLYDCFDDCLNSGNLLIHKLYDFVHHQKLSYGQL